MCRELRSCLACSQRLGTPPQILDMGTNSAALHACRSAKFLPSHKAQPAVLMARACISKLRSTCRHMHDTCSDHCHRQHTTFIVRFTSRWLIASRKLAAIRLLLMQETLNTLNLCNSGADAAKTDVLTWPVCCVLHDRWRHDTGAETMSAAQYIESLESEVQVLRQQVSKCTTVRD